MLLGPAMFGPYVEGHVEKGSHNYMLQHWTTQIWSLLAESFPTAVSTLSRPLQFFSGLDVSCDDTGGPIRLYLPSGERQGKGGDMTHSCRVLYLFLHLFRQAQRLAKMRARGI